MNIYFNKLLNKRLKIVCIFSKEDPSIYYDGTLISYDPDGNSIEILDKHNKRIFIDSDTIKQVAIIERE